jgi:hypothetical protein
MNAKEYKDARWEIIYEYGQSIASGDSVKRVDDILSQLDTLESEYVAGDPIAEGTRPLRERYEDALEVVRKQALCIQELEAKQSLFQDVMGASKTFVERFPGGRLTSQGAHRKMAEEYAEYQVAMERYEESTHDDTPMSLRLRSPYQLRKEAAQELVDLLVTIGGYAASVGLEWGDIEQAAHQTLEKLGKRTTDEYAWFESIMQVAKKSKMESAS